MDSGEELAKEALRREMVQKRGRLGLQYTAASDLGIVQRLLRLCEYKRATVVFCFVATVGEVDVKPFIWEALAEKKRVCVPKCVSRGVMEAFEIKGKGDLQEGKFKIMEPVGKCTFIDPTEIELAIVPCLTCDLQGNRIGYGGGYYDRYLAGRGFTAAAVCREAFLSEAVPTEAYDASVDIIVTERRTHYVRGG